jgi:hypothetical protein
MFPNLPPLQVDEAKLKELGEAMIEDPKATEPDGIPAGYTFLGQFIDHDVTYDPTTLSETQVDPLALTNYRTPALVLDNLYGRGPDIDPHYYERRDPDRLFRAVRFQIGRTTAGEQGHQPDARPFDLQRAEFSRMAIIPDPRNDENLITAQLHLAFQLFHNAVADEFEKQSIATQNGHPIQAGDNAFQAVREIVLLYYRAIILNEFLPQILDAAVLKQCLQQGSLLFRDGGEPYIPVEFSAAAYRFGHGTIRETYEYNSVFSTSGNTGQPATLNFLFRQAGSNRGPIDLPLLTTDWIIDWRRFFPGLGNDVKLNLSKPIGPRLANFLQKLPGMDAPANLAVRNLLRGNSMRLPSGQSIANHFGYRPLSTCEFRGPDGEKAVMLGLDRETPLWYYVLKEAEQRSQGKKLGEVGSRIIAEVMVGLLSRNSSALLPLRRSLTLCKKQPCDFRMADLLTLANCVNPLGTPSLQAKLAATQASASS